MGNDQNLDGIVLKRGIEHQWVLSIMGNPPVRGAPPYLGAWRGLLRRSLHGRRQVRRNEWRLDRTKGRFGRHCKCASRVTCHPRREPIRTHVVRSTSYHDSHAIRGQAPTGRCRASALLRTLNARHEAHANSVLKQAGDAMKPLHRRAGGEVPALSLRMGRHP
eukprot:4791879-Prymnesium_polylepis.5